jgi:hypothetical protein
MSATFVSRLAILVVAGSVIAAGAARADAPGACTFLTTAVVSGALGKPVTGGNMSMVDHPGASKSTCTYMAGTTIVVLSVDERGSAAAAMQEYNTQLDNSCSRERDGAAGGKKTVLEPGMGESAFSDTMVDGSELEVTAVHGSRVFLLGIVGAGAGSLPHERVRSLVQAAISH